MSIPKGITYILNRIYFLINFRRVRGMPIIFYLTTAAIKCGIKSCQTFIDWLLWRQVSWDSQTIQWKSSNI